MHHKRSTNTFWLEWRKQSHQFWTIRKTTKNKLYSIHGIRKSCAFGKLICPMRKTIIFNVLVNSKCTMFAGFILSLLWHFQVNTWFFHTQLIRLYFVKSPIGMRYDLFCVPRLRFDNPFTIYTAYTGNALWRRIEWVNETCCVSIVWITAAHTIEYVSGAKQSMIIKSICIFLYALPLDSFSP